MEDFTIGGRLEWEFTAAKFTTAKFALGFSMEILLWGFCFGATGFNAGIKNALPC
ncbi:hypothetical protein SV7mr_13380 [Stieleria bergensis]|uniref:Uncharacterized protein n=1 Tax=Stieleria bergensis TaxID=2528025 RepID=A0A517SRT3_9BACT|nr:hypothetical protein SV7mr_13380 [Planctomycetes bacterium SV_7m_r]